MDLAEDDQERIYRLLEWRTLAGITMTAPRLFQGMSAHEQQQGDILDGQVSWWLEHGKSVEFLILALFLAGVVILLAVMR